MQVDNEKIAAVLIFLEKRKTRQLVGRLYLKNKYFVFEYDEKYLYSKRIISLGPEFPLTKQKFRSKKLFNAFADRLPSRENPAYPEYCAAMGISVEENDPLVLLTTIGRKGPSSFIFEPEYKITFGPRDLKKFRETLGLSVRDFADCFQFEQSQLTKVETGKAVGHELLKRSYIYAKYPNVALDQIKYCGGVLHSDKKKMVVKILNEMLSQSHLD